MRKRYDLCDVTDNQDVDLNLGSKVKNSIHSVPFYVGIGLVIYFVALYGLVWYLDSRLPTPLTVTDEINYPNHFISERAIHDLKLLTDLGPRITGSYENEILAVDFLMREINIIIHQANTNQKIELDIQVVSGSYNLDLVSVDEINVYSNVQNVVVKLHGVNNSANSVLVNSHFDSVPTSPGGSDDGINVAVMLEVLRKLSRSTERPIHNIIFLFNGAEETPLQASHGFITKHKWAQECKVLVNLEACGAGGKIILFQTGPQTPWLMKYYSSVPYPYGQAAGEEIFQTGWIPSGTDFRIFVEFGNIVGLDMAFFKNGYRYHTKYDDFENIPNGSYQHAGDNTLSLIRNLGNAPELLEPLPTPGKMVYFDVLGFFMISYSTFIAAIVNGLTVILSFGIFVYSFYSFKLGYSKTSMKYIGLTLATLLGGWVLSVCYLFIIAFLLDALNSTMSWYANPWLIIGLYVMPTIALSGSLMHLINHKNLSLNVRCEIQAHLVRLIWTLILLIGTILNIRAMYALLIPVLFNSLGFVFIHIFKWQHTRRIWQIVYLVSLIIPTILTMYQLLITLAMFIPLAGRIGSNKNPELIVGLMTIFFTILITSPYVALVTLLRKAKYFFIFLAAVFVIFLIIVFTPLGFPYRGDYTSAAPQRHWIWHTRRVFHNESGQVEKTDAGIFFLNMDRNSPNKIKPYVKDIAKAKAVQEDCEKYIVCGLPLSHIKMTQIMEYSTWIPANQPIIHEPLRFALNSKVALNSTNLRYDVTISGPDRLGVYLLPKANMKIVSISLLESLKQPSYSYKGRSLFFILFASGKDASNLTFTFDMEVPPDHDNSTVDIAVTAIYLNDKKFVKTPYFMKMIQEFPDWADVTAYLGSYYSYIL